MLARFAPRPTYANVMSTVAVILALSGSAYAAFTLPKNSVGTKQLKNASVTTSKLQRGAVNGSKVANNSLTGHQINAATLGKVPSAAHAAGADSATLAGHAASADSATLAGHAASADSATSAAHAASADSATAAANGAQRIDFSGEPTDAAPAPNAPGEHQVLSLDELTIKASCINAAGQARLYVSFGTSAAAFINWDLIKFDNPGVTPEDAGTELAAGENHVPIDITGGNRHKGGVVVFRDAMRTITVTVHAGAADFTGGRCEIQGTAVAAPS
jgi:hypothetical protein